MPALDRSERHAASGRAPGVGVLFPSPTESAASVNAAIAQFVKSCHRDPLRLVVKGYPWQKPGTLLAHHDGPDRWQAEFLTWWGEQIRARRFDGRHPVMPIRRTVSKGHGVGGSVMAAWAVDFIMATRPHSQGVVTANTSTQLETKTWAAVRRWTKMFVAGHWFSINSAWMYHRNYRESWFCTPQTCREENSEAFAGQHAADSTSFYVFDEASAIPDAIWTVAEGGLTDGEPMFFAFGNSTRNHGRFFEVTHGKGRDKWAPQIIDSRTARFGNKELIREWVDEHGEDSDFVRVRVRGLPPRASDSQFIDSERVRDAMNREDVVTFEDDPLIVGVDFSGGGQAWNVVRFRRGLDARSLPPIRVPGEKARKDRSAFLATLAELLRDRRPNHKVAMMFCDSAYGAPYVERLRAMGFGNVHEINFGEPHTPDERHVANMRAYMWKQSKDWCLSGTLPEDDERLHDDATAPGFHLDRKDRLVLESKESMAKRGVASPDDWDAHVLTFALPVAPRKPVGRVAQARGRFEGRRTPGGGSADWTK